MRSHDAEEQLGEAYDQHAPLIRWLVAHELPVPEVLHAIAEATLRRRVLANLRAEHASFQALRDQLAEAAEVQVSLDTPEIALAASEGLRRLIDRVARRRRARSGAALETVARAAEVAARMKSVVDLWFAQNATFRLLERLPELRERAHGGDAVAAKAAHDLERLARALRLAVPPRASFRAPRTPSARRSRRRRCSTCSSAGSACRRCTPTRRPCARAMNAMHTIADERDARIRDALHRREHRDPERTERFDRVLVRGERAARRDPRASPAARAGRRCCSRPAARPSRDPTTPIRGM